MKRCTECGDELADEAFPIRNSATGVRRGQCLDCYRRICRDQNRTRQQRHRTQGRPSDTATAVLPTADWFVEQEDWQRQGACYQTGANKFFPPQGGDSRTPKAICQTCPVQFQCLEYAIRTSQRYGVWGGLSERERRVIRKRRREQGAVA